ncbi:MAG: hypothetical protein ABWK15_06630 [Dissulfuribacterales bacterium]
MSIIGPRHFPRDFSEDDIHCFSELFAGREQGFAEYSMGGPAIGMVGSDSGCKSSALTVSYREGTLGRDVVLAHLLGETMLGYFPIREDLSVSVIILSYSTGKPDGSCADYQKELLISAACGHVTTLNRRMIPAVLEWFSDTVSRVWFFLQEPVHFLEARSTAKKLVDVMGPSKPEVHLIPLMLTEPDGLEWVEKAIPLPLGMNPVNGKRRLFLDPSTGKTYPDQMWLLRRIQRISIADIKDFIKTQREDTIPLRVKAGRTQSLPAQLRSRCSVFDALLKKAEAGRNFTDEEKRVVFYTAGFFDNDGKAVHEIMRQCPDYKEKSVNRQLVNLYPRPISCIRIRELLPALVASLDCNCIFDANHIKIGRYPSPLLHMQPGLVPPIDERYSADYATAKEIARRYLFEKQELEAKYNAFRALEGELIDAIKRTGKTSVSVDGMCFRLGEDGGLLIN